MLKYLFFAAASVLITSPALADPYKDESGNRSSPVWRGDRQGGWNNHQRYSDRIPPGHLPPPGLCRVWFYDRPAGHQPPPTSCRKAERFAYRYGGRVIWGGEWE
ncbi:hypothetical protein [Sinorhizobium sojae]|uniref:hypothetical protein n=1 Tax=Sinorhizobium sojae TaxID=716925 RepID=UPI0004AE8B53|nr:hypothetical protein [Sinorhizobium sojae]